MKKLQVWPVIHVGNIGRDVENARLAVKHGAAGIMLISMHGDYVTTDACAEVIRTLHPGVKIGVNYLGAEPRSALTRSLQNGFAATWTDEHDVDLRHRTLDHLFFVGVAFKGQCPQDNPGIAAAYAAGLGLIPTTSGDRTGAAPSIEKLAAIRRHLHRGAPFALASGATPENISAFAPFISDVLVSTGISDNFDRFDETKLVAFMTAASAET